MFFFYWGLKSSKCVVQLKAVDRPIIPWYYYWKRASSPDGAWSLNFLSQTLQDTTDAHPPTLPVSVCCPSVSSAPLTLMDAPVVFTLMKRNLDIRVCYEWLKVVLEDTTMSQASMMDKVFKVPSRSQNVVSLRFQVWILTEPSWKAPT